MAALLPFAKRGVPIVGLEPSCIFTFRDELPSMAPSEDAKLLAKTTFLFEEFLAREIEAGRFNPALAPIGANALLHGHCHQKAFDVMGPVQKVLGRVPGLKVDLIESSCCGMAGAFGYQKETIDRVAQDGGALSAAGSAQGEWRYDPGRGRHIMPPSDQRRIGTRRDPCRPGPRQKHGRIEKTVRAWASRLMVAAMGCHYSDDAFIDEEGMRVFDSSMGKLGKPYENIVALVLGALHPGANVVVGEWVEGPDGEREIDVAVNGRIDDTDQFILVECKDWKKKVGIEQIDAIDSKRDDVNATRVMIFSNSGFTSGALRKAARKNVMCVSALVADNDAIRFTLERERVAKRLSVETWRLVLYSPSELPEGWRGDELLFDSMPLKNWFSRISADLLRSYEFAETIRHRITFRKPEEFECLGKTILLTGMELVMRCKRSWAVQSVPEDVSRGLYDHLKGTVLIPNNQAWSLEFDNRNWREVTLEKEPDATDMQPGTMDLQLTLLRPIAPDSNSAVPPIGDLIEESQTVVEPPHEGAAAIP